MVWNPWAEKSGTMVDLENQAFMDFACLEAAIANPLAVELAPGETHRLETTISVQG
ncbi:MAG: hypothetical protein ACPG4K_01070 [Haloferula sp.]